MTKRPFARWKLALVGVVAVTALIGLRINEMTASVTIDPTSRHQTMRGWEVSTRMWELDKNRDRYDGTWQVFAEQVVEKLIDDGGINRVRLEVRSGHENPVDYWTRFVAGEIGYEEIKDHFYEAINDNASPDDVNPAGFQVSDFDRRIENVVLPMKERLEARGEALFLTVNFVDFGWTELKGNFSHAKQPDEYAEFIGFYFERLRDTYGLVPDALELILEPDNTDHWRGREIAEAARVVSAHLDALGFHPQLIAPSTASSKKAVSYYKDIHEAFDGPGPISVLAFHKYNGNERYPLRQIADAASADNIETAMLELTHGDIDGLFDDLLIANVSAWQKYGIARKIENGVPAASDSYMIDAEFNDDRVSLHLSDAARLISPVFRAFRSGATRIGTRTSGRWIRAVAVETPEGGLSVAVRTTRLGSFDLNGLTGGDYSVSFYSEESDAPEDVIPVTAEEGTPVTITAKGAGVLIIESAARP